MKASVLMLASFEKTADHLYEAALRGTIDPIEGVSQCIIMGIPIPVGTGLFQVMNQVETKVSPLYKAPAVELLSKVWKMEKEDEKLVADMEGLNVVVPSSQVSNDKYDN